MNPAIHLAADVKALLGEGPVWIPAEQTLMWVDIEGRRLFRLGEDGIKEWPTPVRVGSIAPRDSGGLIAGTDHGFYTISMDRDGPVFSALFDPEADLPENRFNDGKVDRAGRFWAGTMDDTERQARGSLYRLDAVDSCTTIDTGYRVTNGPAFSPDGTILYHTDSARQTIYRFPLTGTGEVGERTVFAQFVGAEGHPDGMTVDSEGCLWVAFWDGWALRRFSPSGEMMAMVEVPVQRPTSVAFGGPSLDRLYVTSARIGLDDSALRAQPYAGALLMVEPGCKGLGDRPFAG